MSRQILITGATGNVGANVVQALSSSPVGLRLASRGDREVVAPENGSWVRFDFADPSTFGHAVEGCDALFLLRPPAISNVDKTLNALIDESRRSTVRHIVFISVAGAEKNPRIPHSAVERHLMAGPRDWTILRPGFFAQNFETAYRNDILAADRIYVPAGDGRVAFVDLRDVGTLAATILQEPEPHLGAAYTLTGPLASTFHDAARWLTESLDREIRYEPASVPGYLWHLFRSGLTPMHCLVQTVLHAGLRKGDAEDVDPTLEKLLGCKSHDLRDYIAAHAKTWLR